MKDPQGREINYIRLSITDRCNLRCVYCMPEEGVPLRTHEETITLEEAVLAVRAASDLGITKVRITGGEPLVRKGVVDLCRQIAGIPGIREICMTTNGLLLPEFAQPLREAGVDRVNISLDTLDQDKYKKICRLGTLEEATRRIENDSGAPASLEQLAEATGLSEREVSMGLEALQNQLCLSLDAITENISSYQKNQLENEPYKSAEFKELVDKLASLIDDLTPREKLVLSLYYGEELNMRETSEVMGITEGRVSQLHSQALARLRQKFKSQYNIEQH